MNGNINEFLESCINVDKMPHAFLVETKNIQDTLNQIYEILIKNHLIKTGNINNNMSVMLIKPEENNNNLVINKDEILNLQYFLNTKSMTDYYKIYFILNAETLNVSASNKLLKTIEEPNDKIIGFLISLDNDLILETIKSRCEIIKENTTIETSDEIKKLAQKLNNDLSKTYIENFLTKKDYLKLDKLTIIKTIEELRKSYEITIDNVTSIRNIANNIKILDNIISMLYSYTNTELALDKLFIEWKR